MIWLVWHFLGWLIDAFRSREELLLENLALRQQLLALHTKRPRPRLSSVNKLFWVVLRRVWSDWKRSLILVGPESRGSLASDRLSIVLELDIASSKGSGKKTNQQGSARPDLSHGR